MTRRGKRMLGLGVLALGIAVAAALTLTAFRKNLMNFYTPTDLVAATMPAGARMRLGGMVVVGSVHRGEGMKVVFTLADCDNKVPVRYEGLLPDLFREGQGIVASGALGADHVFAASEVLAKHDENYMPPQMAQSMKPTGSHSCMPFKPVTTKVSS